MEIGSGDPILPRVAAGLLTCLEGVFE